ncbi:LysR family transcriptional regulator [Duganella sp. HH105]|uniref:LysR family transcriptional regulator n=1 Tax=Duganella sp. HH105 TaxID=1781067 RepID=UPI000877E5E4|nr:LysR family transcriptional regulator [Duganella sp. HH105]OEZ61968.1 HTH-type transcriptional activator AllS [Duganella sp. HH105]
MNSIGFTLHELACFLAVAELGSFQKAAAQLHRSHPSVFAAVASLERQLGLALLDRSGYRVTVSAAGQAFVGQARQLLDGARQLATQASQAAMGEELQLSVVIGDLCPLPATLRLLRQFFAQCPATRLDLHFEALSGPWERLHSGEADLIFHHLDHADLRFDARPWRRVRLVPVVAPGFLDFPLHAGITPEMMRPYVQCVIRDSARNGPPRDYFVVDGARRCTVADQFMKREVILQGMGWGHMPAYLVDEDLAQGRLLSLAGDHFRESELELVIARRRDAAHGPVAQRLWRHLLAGLD